MSTTPSTSGSTTNVFVFDSNPANTGQRHIAEVWRTSHSAQAVYQLLVKEISEGKHDSECKIQDRKNVPFVEIHCTSEILKKIKQKLGHIFFKK